MTDKTDINGTERFGAKFEGVRHVCGKSDAARKKSGGKPSLIPLDTALAEKARKADKRDLLAHLNITCDMFYHYLRNRRAPQGVIEALAGYFERPPGEIRKRENAIIAPPQWVKRIKDREKRNLVAQEWYVRPERAAEYAECANADEIRALRKERMSPSPCMSAMQAAWEEF
jgi:hypothetical protein